MARRTTRNSRAPTTASTAEWIGAIVELPTTVADTPDLRPHVLVFVDGDGFAVGQAVGDVEGLLAEATSHLHAMLERPLHRGRRPTHVRVASPALAAALAGATLPVSCAPTPELDGLLAGLRERIGGGGEEMSTYLVGDVDAPTIAGLFRAAAALFRAAPWRVVPANVAFTVRAKTLGLDDGVVSVLGREGREPGLMLFLQRAEFLGHLGSDAEPLPKGTTGLAFERGADLGPKLRKEIAHHGWEVAAPTAHPWVPAGDGDPTRAEVVRIEAVARALVAVFADRPQLEAAWRDGPAYTKTVSVETSSGVVDVELSTLRDDPQADVADVLRMLAELTWFGPVDPRAQRDLDADLVRAFRASPEGRDAPALPAEAVLLDASMKLWEETIPYVRPKELVTVMFEVVPGFDLGRVEADAFLAVLRAFYAFLERAGLPQAHACRGILENATFERDWLAAMGQAGRKAKTGRPKRRR